MRRREFTESDVPLDAAAFSWRGSNAYAEASDLPTLRLHQVWQDSCDEGFTVVSHKTGERTTFVKYGETRDSDGDLQATVFVSVNNKTGCTDKPVARLSITIFND
jgi:hypothetical protein